MSEGDFEGIISGLLKGQANIESVSFHFGDCNSTTYMGGEVEEEYEEEYGCGDYGCCPAGFPVVDNDAVAEWVQKKTGINLAIIEKVLGAEAQYLEEIGVAIPVDGGGEEDADAESEGNGASEQKQPSEPKQESAGKESKDDELDALFEGLFPGILGMGLMGALLCDILSSSKKKEDKDGKNE